MKYIYTIFIILAAHCLTNAQSLSGIWEGTYTHFKPRCCGEENYNCRYIIYEDGRGLLWLETTRSPISDDDAIGEIFGGGYKMNDGTIIFNEQNIMFSTNRYVSTCFNQCSWCLREAAVRYSKQGKNEILSGLWNSKQCYPGGEITLKKVAELPPRENLRLIKLGKADKDDKWSHDFDPNYLQKYAFSINQTKPYRPNAVTVYFNGKYIELEVDDISDLDPKYLWKYFIAQNTTMRLDEKGHQTIIYSELKDIRNGRVYPLNPYNITPAEIRNFPVSGSKLTFPNKKEWEEIMQHHNKETGADSVSIKLNEREIKIRQKTITVDRRLPITIKAWDNNVEDGDIISIYINGEPALKNYTLKKEKRDISNLHTRLRKGKNTIVMYAENLGSIPPNTASISIHVGDELFRTFTMESDMGTSEAFQLILE